MAPGVLSVRLLVTSEGGKDVTIDQTSFELSKHMLGDAVCFFFTMPAKPLEDVAIWKSCQLSPRSRSASPSSQ